MQTLKAACGYSGRWRGQRAPNRLSCRQETPVLDAAAQGLWDEGAGGGTSQLARDHLLHPTQAAGPEAGRLLRVAQQSGLWACQVGMPAPIQAGETLS